jgi:hypothetical protein
MAKRAARIRARGQTGDRGGEESRRHKPVRYEITGVQIEPWPAQRGPSTTADGLVGEGWSFALAEAGDDGQPSPEAEQHSLSVVDRTTILDRSIRRGFGGLGERRTWNRMNDCGFIILITSNELCDEHSINPDPTREVGH